MADGTVRGTFDLNTPASRKMRELRREGERTDRVFERLGRTMDKIGDRRQVTRLQGYRREVRSLARDTDTSTRRMDSAWRRSERTTGRAIAKQRTDIKYLRREVKQLGRERAVIRIELSGLQRTLAQLALLERRIAAVGGLKTMGGLGGGRGGGGLGAFGELTSGGARAGASGAFIGTSGIGIATSRTRLLLGVAAAALPTIQALGGAVVALGGSAGMAAIGGGAVAGGGIGALVTGIGGIASVAVPATKKLSEAWKAQQKYTEAVAEFGRKSDQAKSARGDWLRSLKDAPKYTREVVLEAKAFGREWTKATGAAQSGLMRFLRDAIRTGRKIAPTTLAPAAERVTGAATREGRELLRFGRGKRSQAFVRTSAAMFDENLTQARRTGEYVAETMMNITRASRPFLLDATTFIADWTEGWARSTRDIGSTRDKIGRMVEHLKSWRRLFGASGRLVGGLGAAGAGSGKGAVDDLTEWLNVQDRWVRRNPRQVQAFFKRTVNSTKEMARGLARIAKTLNDISTALAPVLDRFSQLVALLGNTGLLQPGVGALAFGAYRGMRGGRGGGRGGAGGGGGAGPGLLALGGGGGGGGRAPMGRGLAGQRVYGGEFRYGAPTSQLGPRARGLGRLGGLAGGAGLAARGAGRAFLPLAVGMSALDFASAGGSVSNRFQSALSGATLGMYPRPPSPDERVQGANTALDQLIRSLPGGQDPRSLGQARAQASNLRTGYRRLAGQEFYVAPGGQKVEDKEGVAALRNAIREELTARHALIREMERERDVRGAQKSRAHGRELLQDFGKAYDIRAEKVGKPKAFTETVSGVLGKLRGMRGEGARILAENTLSWAKEQAKNNPALLKEVEKLEKGIIRRFSRVGRHVKIVNGQILTGSTREWSNIRRAMTTQAERARQEVNTEFTRIQQKAMGSLQAMGYSEGEAKRLVSAMEKGGRAGRVAASIAEGGGSLEGLTQAQTGTRAVPGGRAPIPRRTRGGRMRGRGLRDTEPMADGGLGAPGELVSNRFTERRVNRMLSAFGTSLGAEVGREGRGHSRPMYKLGGRTGAGFTRQQTALRQATGLMGASPGLQPYADIGTRYNLRVTSGRRPGAITSSGNVSLHASGDAIDVSGAAPSMLRYARYMSREYGTGLDELIHTPAGRAQIKNGRSYIFSGQVAADHFDHVHVGDRTPSGGGGARGLPVLGAGGGGRVRLRARRSGLAGVPGALAQRAADAYAHGLQGKLNERIAADGGGGGAMGLAGNFGGGGTSSANMRLGRRMMLAFGYGAGEWPALKSLWQGESGWNHLASNRSSGATGIPQALPGSKMASAGSDWRTNPATQIKWGLGYIRGRYGTPSGALSAWQSRSPHWYSRGGRMRFGGFFRRGGEAVTSGPTAFVAGEGQRSGGREKVTVRRVGPGGGSDRGIAVHVAVGPVYVTGDADINAMAEKIADRAGEKLLEALDKGDDVG